MGKASLIMVLGISLVLAVIRVNITSRATDATTNFIKYISWSQLYSLRTSGIEMAVGAFDRGDTARGTWLDRTVTIDRDNNYRLQVKILRPRNDSAVIYSIVSYRDWVNDTTYMQQSVVELQNQSFSRYAYYTDRETGFSGTSRIYWMGRDTMGFEGAVNGVLHTNDVLAISGSPVFWGRVTTWGGLYLNPSTTNDPHFVGGYEGGVSVTIPNNFDELLANKAAGYVRDNTDLYINLQANGTMKVKTTATGTETTLRVDSVSANGVIMANGGNIYLKGVVGTSSVTNLDLKLTIAAIQKSDGTKGNVYIQDNITYNHNGAFNPLDPLSDPGQGNLLGICADNNIIIENNTDNNTDGVTISATMFAKKGSFYAANYDTRTVSGDKSLRLWGGVIQKTRGPVGTFSGTEIEHGYKKKYAYDPRLGRTRPPFFPMTTVFNISKWWE